MVPFVSEEGVWDNENSGLSRKYDMEPIIGSWVGIDLGNVGVLDLFKTVHVVFDNIVDFNFSALHVLFWGK